MTIGSLKEQVIYPDTFSNMLTKSITKLGGMPGPSPPVAFGVEGDAVGTRLPTGKMFCPVAKNKVWSLLESFTTSEHYSVNFKCDYIGLIYVNIDVESDMYQSAKDSGITLLTIAHKPPLVHRTINL